MVCFTTFTLNSSRVNSSPASLRIESGTPKAKKELQQLAAYADGIIRHIHTLFSCYQLLLQDDNNKKTQLPWLESLKK